MNTALFLAKQIGRGKPEGKGFSRLIRLIAVLSITLSLAIMIVSMAVVTGFQREVREKVIGFGAHIQITNFDYNLTAESAPLSKEQPFLADIRSLPGIKHIQVFATKAGILKTDEDIHGVVFKGMGEDFERDFFNRHLADGFFPDMADQLRSEEILISGFMSRHLQLQTGQDVFLYFIQDPPRIRRFTISGIYDTGLEELDRLFVLGDIRHIQRLNDWDEDQIGGFEILAYDYQDIPKLTQQVLELLPYDLDARSIRQVYPQIFDWLALLDMNVVVILVLMLLVAAINMITTLLISILEKTSFIGIIKAMGGGNILIRKVFLYNAGFLIVKGLLFGNLLGLSLLWIQNRTGLIKLSQESYYVTEVPVNVELFHLASINAGTLLICMLMLVVPSLIATKVSPVKAIAFR